MAEQASTPPAPDPARVLAYARRVAGLDDRVFVDLAADDSVTAAAFVLPAALMLGSALAGLLELVLGGAAAQLNWPQFVLRQIVLGTAIGWGAWFGWVQGTHVLLARGGVEVAPAAIARVLSFALLPIVLGWLFFIPRIVLGAGTVLGDVSFAMLAVAYVAMPVLGLHAVQAVAPRANSRLVTASTALPYLVMSGVVALAGHLVGAAPLLSFYQSGSRAFFGQF